jgi:hypothetical protein
MRSEIDDLIERFSALRKGEIVKTQTTFVEIIVGRRTIRIHYLSKREFVLDTGKFTKMQVFDEHPLLIDHIDPIFSIHLASGVSDKAKFRNGLATIAQEIFGRCRTYENYLNMPLDEFLAKNYGILMYAPKTYAEAVVEMAEKIGVNLILRSRREQDGSPSVILFDEKFVVADDFRIQYID